MLNPDMKADQLLLHFSEMTQDEMRVARAAIRLANSNAVEFMEEFEKALRDRIEWHEKLLGATMLSNDIKAMLDILTNKIKETKDVR